LPFLSFFQKLEVAMSTFKRLPWCLSSSFGVVWGSSTWKMIFFFPNLLTSHSHMFYATLPRDGIQYFWNEHWALNIYRRHFHSFMFITSLHFNHPNDFSYFFNSLMDISLVYIDRCELKLVINIVSILFSN
jgi:hypothetical protein